MILLKKMRDAGLRKEKFLYSTTSTKFRCAVSLHELTVEWTKIESDPCFVRIISQIGLGRQARLNLTQVEVGWDYCFVQLERSSHFGPNFRLQ